MTADRITNMSKRQRRCHCALAVAITIGALAIPATASGFATTGGYDSNDVVMAGASGSSQPAAQQPAVQTGAAAGFEWGSAVIGAGVALASIALGAVALITVRKHTELAPSTRRS